MGLSIHGIVTSRALRPLWAAVELGLPFEHVPTPYSDGATLDGLALETALKPNADWTIFARAERLETDELDSHAGGGHGDVARVGKASIGAIRDWRVSENVKFGVGGLLTANSIPGGLKHAYGSSPSGGMAFVRLKIG